jgi:hypothetical protein
MTPHKTGDIAAYIVELFQRTPEKDRTRGNLDSAGEQKFPGLAPISLFGGIEGVRAVKP